MTKRNGYRGPYSYSRVLSWVGVQLYNSGSLFLGLSGLAFLVLELDMERIDYCRFLLEEVRRIYGFQFQMG